MEVVVYAVILIAYFAVMIFVGVKSRKSATSVQGFVLGGRNAGPWLSAFAYGTSYFSAVIFIGYAGQFGWQFGVAATWIGIGNAVLGSLLAWAVLGRRTRIMAQRLDSATMPDFFGKRFGDGRLRIAASVIIFIFLIPYTASLYKGLGSLFASAFDIPYAVCIVIMAVVTAVYVLIGGYMATAWNDFIQGLIMLFGIVAVVVAVLSNVGGLDAALTELSQIPASGSEQLGAFTSFFGPDLYGLVMVILLTSLGTWGLPQMVQKFYAIKSESSIKKGMIISTLFALIVAGGCYFLGGFGRLFTNGDTSPAFDEIIPTMLQESNLHVLLFAVVLVLVVSASMSTLSSLVMSSSSTITLDLINGCRKKEMTPRAQMISIRSFIALFIVLSAVIAIIYEEFKLSFIAQMMGVSWGALAGAFLAPYLYSLFWKRTTKASCWACFGFGVAMSIAALVISLIGADRLPDAFVQSPIYTHFFSSSIFVGAWTMIIGFAIVPIVSLLTKRPDDSLTEGLFSAFKSAEEAIEEGADKYLNRPRNDDVEDVAAAEPEKRAGDNGDD